jgi:hypothetical protein
MTQFINILLFIDLQTNYKITYMCEVIRVNPYNLVILLNNIFNWADYLM